MKNKAKDAIEYKKLRLYKKLDDDYKDAFNRMVGTLEDSVLRFMPMFSRYFTDHGSDHSKEVAQMMDKLIVNLDPPINKYEAFILLSSAWLHDIGMLSNIDPQTGLHLEDHQIREIHADLSADTIDKCGDKLFDDTIPKYLRLISEIKSVCKYHTADKDKWDSLKNVRDPNKNEIIRTKLLISILRLADLLDLRSGRAPRLLGDIVKIPSESSIHWDLYRIIDSYEVKQEGKKLQIKVNGFIKNDDRKQINLNLFFSKISEIEEQIAKVKEFFTNENVILESVVISSLKSGEDEISEKPAKTSTELKNLAKESIIELEYNKLKDEFKSPFLLFDYCLRIAEEVADNSQARIDWRSRAQDHANELSNNFPPSSFLRSRIKYNDLYLEKLKLGGKGFSYIYEIEDNILNKRTDLNNINPSDIFLYGMFSEDGSFDKKSTSSENDVCKEKIHILHSLKYLKRNINRNTDEYLFETKKTLVQYGFTSIHEEVLRAIHAIVNNQVVSIDKEKDLKAVHNECSICTGQVLSILAYWLGMDLFSKYLPKEIFVKNICSIFYWIQTQGKNNFAKLNSPTSPNSPRAVPIILKGLLDLHYFNERKKIIGNQIDQEEIQQLIITVKNILINDFDIRQTKKQLPNIADNFTRIFAENVQAISYFQKQIDPEMIYRDRDFNKSAKEFLKLKYHSFYEQLSGWSSYIFWDNWKNALSEQIKAFSINTRDNIILKSHEWRINGSFNNDFRMTEKAVTAWFVYWEHYWGLEEKKKEKTNE